MFVTLTSVTTFDGYLPERRQPTWVARFRISPDAGSSLLEAFDAALGQALAPGQVSPNANSSIAYAIADRLLKASCAILIAGSMPMFDRPRLAKDPAGGDSAFVLQIPAAIVLGSLARAVIGWPIALFNSLATAGSVADMAAGAEKLIAIVTAHAPDSMQRHFLMAADELSIPWSHVVDRNYRFGWGRNGRVLQSSFTDRTPGIGVQISRNKMACAVVLRKAGLPVPEHVRVRSLEQALNAANTIGYPVVVKPGDLDGGVGVFANLGNQDDVAAAYARSAEKSEVILVEKHCAGEDYRVQVHGDDVYWIAHRRPASVIGDGVSTIEGLIDATNKRRSRETVLDPAREQGIKPILIDHEVMSHLSTRGLTLGSVIEAGLRIKLRGAANVASGGTRAPVPLDQAHPDNVALAVRAARILGLDLAGIDLIIPDIAKSWVDTGAAICEVNAMPQMSHHLPVQVLAKLVNGGGRIPIVGVLGSVRESSWFENVEQAMAKGGLRMGVATSEGGWLDGCQVVTGGRRLIETTAALLADRFVDALLIEFDSLASVARGVAVDRMDALIFAPTGVAGPDSSGADGVKGLLDWLLPFTPEVWSSTRHREWQGILHGARASVRFLDDAAIGRELERTLAEAFQEAEPVGA